MLSAALLISRRQGMAEKRRGGVMDAAHHVDSGRERVRARRGPTPRILRALILSGLSSRVVFVW